MLEVSALCAEAANALADVIPCPTYHECVKCGFCDQWKDSASFSLCAGDMQIDIHVIHTMWLQSDDHNLALK